jgi:glutathione S-transferase
MTRKLYDLAAADGTRFSPFCWRAKLALAHKGLDYETIPWRFTDKAAIAAAGQDKVPVLVDGANIVSDSQMIADYLERSYPNAPSLYGEPPARALCIFVKSWTEGALHPAIAAVVMPDICERLDPRDQPYFRQTREAMFKRSLEEMAAARPEAEKTLHTTLKPLQRLLASQDFIAGEAPNWADHLVFGALQWARLISAKPLFAPDDPVIAWMGRVLAAYGLEGEEARGA